MKTSASRLKVYNVCPLQFKYSYILKLLQLESEALLIGSAYHKALEEYYKTTAQPTAVALQKMLKKYLENPIT